MRLIDADGLKDDLVMVTPEEAGKEQPYCYPCKKIFDAIDNAPTVDARKVVYCCQCKYFERDLMNAGFGTCCHPDWVHGNVGFEVDAGGYCYRGEALL